LTTSSQTDLTEYTVTITGSKVRDTANNFLINTNTAVFIGSLAFTLSSADAVNNTTVRLTFSYSIDPDTADCDSTAACSAIYAIPGLGAGAVSAAVPQTGADDNKVLLTTASHTSDSSYAVTVASGVVWDDENSISCDTPNNTKAFIGDRLPYIVSASSIGPNDIYVTFSETVLWTDDASGALLNTNYCIELLSDVTPQTCDNPELGDSEDATVSSVTGGTVVKITHDTAQTGGVQYRVTVQNVVDGHYNSIDTQLNANVKSFSGLENLKIMSAHVVEDSTDAHLVFKVTFSRPVLTGESTHAADNIDNWSFDDIDGTSGTVSLCASTVDPVCVDATDGVSEIYFVVEPTPDQGVYIITGATDVDVPAGADGCIWPDNDTACLQMNPNDRASLAVDIPENIGEGPVWEDPFDDASTAFPTVAGQALKYKGKLLIGPNNIDSALYQMDYNMDNAVTIMLDAYDGIADNQSFQYDSAYANGIDYMYAACNGGSSKKSEYTGQECVDDGGTERLYIVGYKTNASTGYRSIWMSDDNSTPFIFSRSDNLSHYSNKTFRAMSMRLFRGYVYTATQHQKGSYAIRASRVDATTGVVVTDNGGSVENSTSYGYGLGWRYITRLGHAGTIRNGQCGPDGDTCDDSISDSNGLISVDNMYEYDYDATGSNLS